jgi:hypothetical protein
LRLSELAVDPHPDGSFSIFHHGRQYRRVPNTDAEPRWSRRTSNGWRTVSAHRARRLEKIFQRRDALKLVLRSPRLKSALEIGQPVFHAALGYGNITAIVGNDITFSWRNDSTVTHTVEMLELITKSQAEAEFGASYFSGGAKAWRRKVGRWAWVHKNLCLMEGKGAYGEWLKRLELNRSSIDDLIRRFQDAARREAQERAILPESGKTDERDPAHKIGVSPDTAIGRMQVNERTPDPENDERHKNIQAETLKRKDIKPTYHKTILYLQRRNLDPEKLARYNTIRENDKKHVDAIMLRKIDEGIDEVLALTPATRSRNQRSRLKLRRRKGLRRPQQREATNVRA